MSGIWPVINISARKKDVMFNVLNNSVTLTPDCLLLHAFASYTNLHWVCCFTCLFIFYGFYSSVSAPVGKLDVWRDCGISPANGNCVLTWKVEKQIFLITSVWQAINKLDFFYINTSLFYSAPLPEASCVSGLWFNSWVWDQAVLQQRYHVVCECVRGWAK